MYQSIHQPTEDEGVDETTEEEGGVAEGREGQGYRVTKKPHKDDVQTDRELRRGRIRQKGDKGEEGTERIKCLKSRNEAVLVPYIDLF